MTTRARRCGRSGTWISEKPIARQPAQIAYSIVDAKTADSFMPSGVPLPDSLANSIGELARLLTLSPATLARTVETFNGAVRPGTLNPQRARTIAAPRDCSPSKTHWAQRLDTPPDPSHRLPGDHASTYLGFCVDAPQCGRCHVVISSTCPRHAARGSWSNLLLRATKPASGTTIGTVFGRIAGEEVGRQRLVR